MNCSKIKRKGDELDCYYLPDDYCIEVWIKNAKLLNGRNNKPRLYLIELHCYEGFAMVKFFPKFMNGNRDKYKLRNDEIYSKIPPHQVRKVLRVCGDMMSYYLEKNPTNYVGYVGQTDYKDNIEKRKRYISQRSNIYEVFVNTKFKRPKYSILDNKRLNEFNIKLVRNVLSNKGVKFRTTQQTKNYNSFIENFKKLKSEELVSMMTHATLEKYYNPEI